MSTLYLYILLSYSESSFKILLTPEINERLEPPPLGSDSANSIGQYKTIILFKFAPLSSKSTYPMK